MVGVLGPGVDRGKSAVLIAVDEDANAELGGEMRRQCTQQRQRQVELPKAAQGDVLAEGEQCPAAETGRIVSGQAGRKNGGRFGERLRQCFDQRITDLERTLHQFQRFEAIAREPQEFLPIEDAGATGDPVGDIGDDAGVQQVLQWLGHRSAVLRSFFWPLRSSGRR
ncbi:hypothetical protein D9M70_469790 [compost metagenome]